MEENYWEMKRRVLFLIESLAGGGAEKVLTTLVQHIDKDKFDVTVCAISGGGKYEETVREVVNYHAILREPIDGTLLNKFVYTLKHHLVYKWLPLSWAYRLFVPQFNDVEIAYVEGFTTRLLSHSTNRKAKKYAWVHIDLYENHWTSSVYKSLQEEVSSYNQYTKILGVANTVVEAFQKRFSGVTTPIETIYNPIDSNAILSQSKAPIAELKGRGICLVSIGRLESQKGYTRLLRIVKKLIGEGTDISLWILGDGTEKGVLDQYINDNQLQGKVKLLGFQTNPYRYLVRGDLFVCSSLSEGYSTSVTEALILGLPVITTDCSGMAELLKDGECGVITDNSEEALYGGLKKMLTDSELLDFYKNKAIERGRDFQMVSLMKPIEALLME